MGGGSLPLSLAIHVDRACLRFEAAWTAGERPSIEDVLAEAVGPGTRGSPERVDPDRSLLWREAAAPSHKSTWTAFTHWIRSGWTNAFIESERKVGGVCDHGGRGESWGRRGDRGLAPALNPAAGPRAFGDYEDCKKSAAAAWAWSIRPGTTGCGEPKRSR